MPEKKYTDADLAKGIKLHRAGLGWPSIAGKLGIDNFHSFARACLYHERKMENARKKR